VVARNVSNLRWCHCSSALQYWCTTASQSISSQHHCVSFISVHCLLTVLQLKFERGPHGKPHLIPESAGAAAADVASQLQFNLSHTEALLGEQQY
jgi:phosphopantetheinyl transferase